VIIGVHGGIGRALFEALDGQAAFASVRGFSRTSTPPLDLMDETSIAGAARHVVEIGKPLRLVIDATGFLHGAEGAPEKSWRDLDPAAMAHAFAINATGPALVMKHFLPVLPRDGKAVFASLSARVGSIGDNRLGGWYSYRASKAALNQLVRTAAVEMKRRAPDAICTVLHPGTVDTRLSAPFARTGLDVQSPAQAANRLLAVIDSLDAYGSGGFYDHRGERVEW
jgi:NAD(P)-dependent dehydrogenase (short-subunit alcohol dehydrogenase family)